MKALVGEGAFSVIVHPIVEPMGHYTALVMGAPVCTLLDDYKLQGKLQETVAPLAFCQLRFHFESQIVRSVANPGYKSSFSDIFIM